MSEEDTRSADPESTNASKQNGTADSSTNAQEDKTEDTMSDDNLSQLSVSDGSIVEELPEDPVEVAAQLKDEGNAKFKVGKYGEAIDLYTKAHQLNPNEPSYLTNRAACHMAIKHYRSAFEDCQSAVLLQGASPQPKTLLRLARCQLALGQPSPALSTVNSVLSLEPNNTEAITLRQKVNTLQSHLDRYHQAVEGGEWSIARFALENAEKFIDGSIPIEWRCWKIDIEIHRRRWDAATSAASDALRFDPSSPEVLTVRALVLFLTNRIPDAIKHVQSALRYDPEYSRARLLLRRAREIESLKEEGNVAFKAGRLAEAIEKYTNTLEAIGERPEEGEGGQLRALVLGNRATAFYKAEKYQEALIDVNASLKMHPAYYKSLRTRARIRLVLEEYEDAIQDFKDAHESSMIEAGASEQKSIEKEIRLAEVQLKRSKTKDYYKILNLTKTCSSADIKKAYRRESLIHHPDKGGDEEKFKLVVEAHAVLSDSARRRRYDAGHDEDGQTESGGMGGTHGFDMSDLFSSGDFGGFSGGFRAGRGNPFGF
ncbi:DnaJ-domain-containing protein [Cantharellus anzutake]|uniref:DnaJ-domain-containing protein n=1 Tax=Cantharellus anzutake TaxID=1750568 RepID=UPI0019076300|nr:DnaJ-domain-containing protein [Cantharellus anzutake]KAF8329361.1 DnaJ-domain-containing protein [Cantharellus anzutake]